MRVKTKRKIAKALDNILDVIEKCGGPGSGVPGPCPTGQGQKLRDLTGLAKTGADAGRRLMDGVRLSFHDGEYKGMTGVVGSIIHMRYNKEEITYRIQIDGFPKPGGWNGQITQTAATLMRHAKEIVSE